jgi:hypothetical protein
MRQQNFGSKSAFGKSKKPTDTELDQRASSISGKLETASVGHFLTPAGVACLAAPHPRCEELKEKPNPIFPRWFYNAHHSTFCWLFES